MFLGTFWAPIAVQRYQKHRGLGAKNYLLSRLILNLLSYRNQFFDLLCKSMDRFFYVRNLRRERVNIPHNLADNKEGYQSTASIDHYRFTTIYSGVQKETDSNSSIIRQKGESQNGGNMKTKHAKFSEKTYQGVRNVRFFGKFSMLCFLVASVLRFTLLPYYRRTELNQQRLLH